MFRYIFSCSANRPVRRPVYCDKVHFLLIVCNYINIKGFKMIYNISQHFGYTCNENANFKKAVETALCKYRVRNLRIGRFFCSF